MEVNKRLARDAKKKGICEEWYGRLIDTKGKDELIKMYLEGIDFCLSNEYPSNEFIRQHFVGTCEAYGVWAEKSMYGRKYMGVLRTTFVIDAEGRIEKIFTKVDTKNHYRQIIDSYK